MPNNGQNSLPRPDSGVIQATVKSYPTARKSRLPLREGGIPVNPGTENSGQRDHVEVRGRVYPRRLSASQAPSLEGQNPSSNFSTPMSNRIFVVKHPEGWAVKRPGADRASFVTQTQADSISRARSMAKSEGAELTIQGRDGKFRDSDSHGRDPFPPQG